MVEVSVVMCVYNVARYIEHCLTALLNQSHSDFELVIVDDHSTDNTVELIMGFNDKRVRLLRNNKNFGVTASRNIAIAHASGRYLFFTDGDCAVDREWIRNGLKVFRETGCAGIEGVTYFVGKDYKPCFADKVIDTRVGGQYMTCNMAYTREIIDRVGLMDDSFGHCADRDFALRVKKHGIILFSDRTIVTHLLAVWTVKGFIKSASRIKSRVKLFKIHHEQACLLGRIVYPRNLLAVLFPPLTLLIPFCHRFRRWDDLKLIPFLYPMLLYERLILWRECLREGVFLV